MQNRDDPSPKQTAPPGLSTQQSNQSPPSNRSPQSNSQSPQGNNKSGQQRRQYHVAKRRSPSELTPLMVEQLALQQQIEMLQAQQQQILAQHHQFSQAGLLPPLVPQAAYVNAATAPFGQFAAPPNLHQPNMGHGRGNSGMGMGGMGPMGSMGGSPHVSNNNNNNNKQSPTHRRAQSSVSHYSPGGHTRRHSLALSEAKKAAAIAQAKRHENEDQDIGPTEQASPSGSGRSELRHSLSGASPSTASSTAPSSAPFKFPSTPEQQSALQHGRSQSVQYPSSSRRSNLGPSAGPQFQFPARDESPQFVGSGGPVAGVQHQRSGSRNFEANWRDQQQSKQQQPQQQQQQQQGSHNFVPGHRTRGSFNSISSISQFYGSGPPGPGGQPTGQQPRKSLFTPYLPQASLPALLEEGRLVAGTLRVNKKNRSDAYVSTDGLLDADIFICGSKDRNRALEGDLVAVELLDVDEVWGSKREKEEKKKRRDAPSFDERSDNTTLSVGSDLRRKGSLKQRPVQKKNDDVEVEGQSLLLSEEEELSDEYKPLYAGHIVAVIERIPGQMFSGTLGILRPSSQATKDKQDAERREKGEVIAAPESRERPKIVWFKPTDKRVPLFAIPTEQAPKDFVVNHEAYANQEFVASIKRWPITSLHPFGTLVEQLGPAASQGIQIEAILRDNNYSAKSFNEAVLRAAAEVTPLADVSVTPEFESGMLVGITGRRHCDMAIQIRNLSDDNDRRLELAIHIADVTHFLKDGSPLEKEARRRGCAVSLPQQEVELFPEQFSELASFRKGVSSPAFTVVFEIDNVWDIVDTRIVQTVVKPTEIMTFDEFDKLLNQNRKQTGITAGHLVKTMDDYVVVLDKLSHSFKKNRLSLGNDGTVPGLPLISAQEDDSQSPSVTLFDYNPTQSVISEISIKVNCAVAQHLYAHISSRALLRRQPEPVLSKLEAFSSLVTSMDLPMDTSSAVGLQKSLFSLKADDQRMAIETLLSKALAKGRYFVAGKVEPFNYPHYWLSVPLYTHFDEPLTRYADLIVQRQLRSILKGQAYDEDLNSLSSAAEYCNFKRESARNAQEQALHLQLCQKITQMSEKSGGVLIRKAIVIQVYESAFDVLIPDLGIEKRVHGDQLPLAKAEFNKKTRVLDLFWEKGVDAATFVPDDERKKTNSPDEESLTFALSQIKLSDCEKHLTNELVLREENGSHIQEIRALQHVPVLVRAQVGKGIPCITVRTVNPFA